MLRATVPRLKPAVMMALAAALVSASVPALGARVRGAQAGPFVLTSAATVPSRPDAGLSRHPSRETLAYIPTTEHGQAIYTASMRGGMEEPVRETRSGDASRSTFLDHTVESAHLPSGLSLAPAGPEAIYLKPGSHSVLAAQNAGGKHRWVYAGIKAGQMSIYPFAKWLLRFRSSW